MDLGAVHGVLGQWVRALDEQGLVASHVHSFDARPEGLAVVTFLSTARLDPGRRAHVSRRNSAVNVPLARLEYVVAVSGSTEAIQAEQVLLSLLLEAARHPSMRPLPDPVSATWWLAQGLSPLPSFQLEASVTEFLAAPGATPIKEHSVDMSALEVIHGQVTSAGGRPVPGAEVELEALGQVVHSDRDGRFYLSVVGGELDNQLIRVQTAERQQSFSVADVTTEDGRWLLRMSATEGGEP